MEKTERKPSMNNSIIYEKSKKYQQLSLDERKTIQRLYDQGRSLRSIARHLHRSPNTISLEIKRNGKRNLTYMPSRNVREFRYSAVQAHDKYVERRANNFFYDFAFFLEYLCEHFDGYLSFEQIRMNFMKKNPEYRAPTIKTIYNWYYSKKIKTFNVRHLLKYNKKPLNNSKKGMSIHDREISLRDYTTPRHYEIDTVVPPKGKSKECILTLNERANMKYYAEKIKNKTSLEVTKGLIRLLKKHNLKIKTITSDNGTEFSLYKFFINKYDIKWYFADPYKSGQRGQNERLNRDLRKFLKKGSSFDHISPKELEDYVNKINDLPRKKFNGLSANEMHSKIYATID